MERVILHVDMNSFYAAVECMYRPGERHLPLAVGGDAERRHGIILAKNEYAKRFGVKTAEALWEARQKCPGLHIVPPDYPLYMRFSKMARRIYADYTPCAEPFGLDECWLDLSDKNMDIRGGALIAEELHERIINELGLTVSVGVSWNKVFAKLGSDLSKPDGTVVISRENYRDRVWPLPVEDLLYVGRATKRKLNHAGIRSIGDLAACDAKWLSERLGKVGLMLQAFARGEDCSEVRAEDEEESIKSIGNSVTTPRDLLNEEEVKLVFFALAESVAARLREQGLEASCISITLRDAQLFSFARQQSLPRPSNLTMDILQHVMLLYRRYCPPDSVIRSLGIKASRLSPASPEQLAFGPEAGKRAQYAKIDSAIDHLRSRFGYKAVRRAYLLQDELGELDAKGSHVIAPVSFLKGGDEICLN